MLKFARNKLVTAYWKNPDSHPGILMVHGVLDDDIYSLEIEAEITLPDMVFTRVTGKWNRYTTPECPRALDHIHEVEGLRIDAGIEQKLQKGVGRTGCRHYATLLIECVKTVRETMNILGWETAAKNDPDLSFSDFIADPDQYRSADTPSWRVESNEPEPPPEQAEPPTSPKPIEKIKRTSGGFIVDLHTHTFPASKCATDSVQQIIQEAKAIGLDGICLTDHNYRWKEEELEALRQKHGFLILGGNEVTTDQGHMVAFGLDGSSDRYINGTGIVKLNDLRSAVLDEDGFMIVAHPFRGFLTFGVGKLGLTVEKAVERPLFGMVDAVEILNGKVTAEEHGFSAKVADHLGLPVTGGSDAHVSSEVGCYATEFEKPIHDQAGFIEALKNGRYHAISFRGNIGE